MRRLILAFAAVLFTALPATAQNVTPPADHFGFSIGDDYQLATYDQFESYWQRIAAETDRMRLVDIGPTAQGRTQWMAVVTSPENQANLARYQEISSRMALAGDVETMEEAMSMAAEGKPVIWIDGGLHATEVLGAHQLIETSYQFASFTDQETLRLLDDVIILFTHANPDGMQMVSEWYMRPENPEDRTTGGLPVLYHEYVGHDNNRDSYMVAMPETENMARVLYIEWMPQIMYNHHQVGPGGTIMWAPPFRYPANYNIDPLVQSGIEEVGMAMQSRFLYEDKPGVTMREGGPFSTWWNGGLRTTAYFHNIIGLLTETVGNPTPMEIPFVPSRTLPDGDYLDPIAPQTWHFRQSVDYSVTANRAVLDYAARNGERLLMNIWKAGRNAIERGRTDSWTITPKDMAHLQEVLVANDDQERFFGPQTGALAGYFTSGVPAHYYSELQRPEDRDPRGYILPANQSDFPTATKFVNSLIKNGVTVHRATRAFTVDGVSYPAESYVVKTDQAYAPHVFDMFEPQDHPNDFAYEGGPPIPPYDNAGYTLALQMGVEFDRVLEGFDGPFTQIEGMAVAPGGRVLDGDGAAGFLMSHAVNDGAVVTNRLLSDGHPVHWSRTAFRAAGEDWPAGTVYIPNQGGIGNRLAAMATELGIDFQGVRGMPEVDMMSLSEVRVGLWDQYGGSMPSGWTRWIFEQFEFGYDVVYPQDLDEGDLRDRFDVLVFVTGAIPAPQEQAGDGYAIFGQGPDDEDIPEEYRHMLGRITESETIPELMQFMEDGGTIITIGSSVAMAQHAGLPVTNHLVDGGGNPLGADEYYVPGSVMRVKVDNTQPIAFGLDDEVNVYFNNAPVMRLQPAAMSQGVTPIAWFDSDSPLQSGWAWGQQRLNGGVAMAQARVGEGNLFMFGPEITKRSQPHGTYKLLFNGIFLAGVRGPVIQ